MSAKQSCHQECGLREVCTGDWFKYRTHPCAGLFRPPLLTAMLNDSENGGSGEYLFIGH